MASFIELAAEGRVEDDEIGDFVDRWHKAEEDLGPIYSFLGMSEPEYAAWALDPEVLPHIITARVKKVDFETSLRSVYEERLAARSGRPDQLAIIKDWLARQPS